MKTISYGAGLILSLLITGCGPATDDETSSSTSSATSQTSSTATETSDSQTTTSSTFATTSETSTSSKGILPTPVDDNDTMGTPPDMPTDSDGTMGTPPDSNSGTDTTSDASSTKSGAYEQDGGSKTLSDQTYTATESDQSGVYVYGGGTLSLSDSTVTKESGDSSDSDSSNFTGMNAIVLAEDSSTVTLDNVTMYSNTDGSNGAFAYGEGTTMIVKNSTITTLKDSSRGVDVTYGGDLTVTNTVISTQGAHCAAVASDRGEGTITADGVTGTTQGEGSPGIYCTGDFTISNSTFTANGSEAAVIEGLNSITMTDSDITGYVKHGVFIYQSNSGDSTVGTGTFSMTNGSITNHTSGALFFVVNTTAVINIDNVTLNNDSDILLKAVAPSEDEANTLTSWGSLGGSVTFTATDEAMEGEIICDNASSIDLTLKGTSTLEGAFDSDNTCNDSLTLESEKSVWTATGDSYVASISGVVINGSTPANIDAPDGVSISYGSLSDESGTSLSGTYTLISGGTLQPE